jgi:hypothetical protein
LHSENTISRFVLLYTILLSLFLSTYLYNEDMSLYQKPFFITEPVSNNRFDSELRSHPEIYVPSLIEGDLEDVQIADTIAIETLV